MENVKGEQYRSISKIVFEKFVILSRSEERVEQELQCQNRPRAPVSESAESSSVGIG